jgi:hypothetical protein
MVDAWAHSVNHLAEVCIKFGAATSKDERKYAACDDTFKKFDKDSVKLSIQGLLGGTTVDSVLVASLFDSRS